MNIFTEFAKSHRIVDFHMHPYVAASENICKYKQTLAMSPADVARDMERSGIALWCGSVIDTACSGETVCTDWKYIAALNARAMELAAAEPRYIPGIHVHPAFPEESYAAVERAHAAGVKLIGELVPYIHGWRDYSDPALSEVWELAGRLGMVVSYHSGDDEQMEAMIKAHPQTIFVAAHPGEYDKYMKHLDRLKKYDNAYLDISGTGLFRHGMLEHGVKTVGSGRILFGSDYPTCSPGMNLGGVLYERLSDDDLENILCGNAERLLKL